MLNKEELTTMIQLHVEAQERLHHELQRIEDNNPPILGVDGQPLPSQFGKIMREVSTLFANYLEMPTLDELKLVPSSLTGQFAGASLCATALCTQIFQPLISQEAPLLAHVGQPVLLHFLAYVDQAPIDPQRANTFLQEVGGNIKLQGKDEQGRIVLLTPEMEKAKQDQINILVGCILTVCVDQGLIDSQADTNLITMTDKGRRALHHILASHKHVHEIVRGKKNLEETN